MNNNCPFCLENNLLRNDILHQDDLWYFVSFPEGAIENGGMAMSLRHVETPFDLTIQEWTRLHELLPVYKSFIDVDSPDGYNIGWNISESGGQHVNHAHLHIIGRYNDEPLAGKGIRYIFKQPTNTRGNSHTK